jgi:putative membrane protein
MLEALLAYAHFVAILSLVVFLTSEAALCRPAWMNAAVVRRLSRVDTIYMFAALAVLATGVTRTLLGAKGAAWYWHQPLLHFKVTMYVVIGLMSIRPTLAFRRWVKALDRDGSLPAEAEVRNARRWIMVQAHLLVVVPLAATMLARGVWVR